VTYQPANEGPAGRSTPSGDASAAKWPVLARLPWVAAESVDERDAHLAMSAYSEPQYGGEPPERMAPTTRILPLSSDANRNHAHWSAEPPSWHVAGSTTSFESPSRAAAESRRHRRIDPGNPGAPAPPKPALVTATADASTTLAARVFQWHATLAPYAGVAMTFVLALFAGLLYFSMFGRPGSRQHQVLEAPSAGHQSNGVEESNTCNSMAAPTYDRPESPLPHTPTVRLEIPKFGSAADDDAIAAAPAEAQPDATRPAAEVMPIEEPAAPTSEPNDPAITAVEPTSPSPAAHQPSAQQASTITYPRTPFASFDFAPTQPPAEHMSGTNPAAIMHVPMYDSVPSGIPR
jgi:hypothetical protein